MSQNSNFHTLAAVAPCQAVFAGDYVSLWLTCKAGASTVNVRDARTEQVQPLPDAPAVAVQAAFDAALAGSEHIQFGSPAGEVSLVRIELVNGYEYCLTRAVRAAGDRAPALPLAA